MSQLSGVRRAAAAASGSGQSSSTIQIQHLHDQLRAERDNSQAARQSLFSSMLNSTSLAAAAAAAAAAVSTNTTTTTTSTHPLSSGSQSAPITNVNPFSLNTVQKTNQTVQQQQQQQQQLTQHLSGGLINNHILELPNLFQSTSNIIGNVNNNNASNTINRDSRFLLSKYDTTFSSDSSEQSKKSSQHNSLNSANQGLFTHDIIYSILMEQLSSDDEEDDLSDYDHNDDDDEHEQEQEDEEIQL